MSFEFEILMQTNFHKVLAHFLTQDSLLHLDFSMNRGWWFQSCLLHGFSPMDTPRLSVAETLLQVVTWSTWITWIKSTWLKRKWQYLHLFYIHCNVWYLMICIYHRYLVYLYNISTISGWRFGTFFIFPYIGNNNPIWLIFFRGVETTNQGCTYIYIHIYMQHILFLVSWFHCSWPSGFRPCTRPAAKTCAWNQHWLLMKPSKISGTVHWRWRRLNVGGCTIKMAHI